MNIYGYTVVKSDSNMTNSDYNIHWGSICRPLSRLKWHTILGHKMKHTLIETTKI